MENISATISTALTPSCLQSAASDDGGTGHTGLHDFRLVFHAAVMLLGLPGNSLILCVYWTKRQKSSTHVLIMSLAWADLTVCLLQVLDITSEAYLLSGERYPTVIHVLLPFENTAVAATIMITTFIAADRYDCVCRPHRRLFTTRRAKMAGVASVLLSFIFNIPAFILVSTHSDSLILSIFVYASQLVAYVIMLVTITLCYRQVYLTIRNRARVNSIRAAVHKSRPPRQPYEAPKPSESNDSMTDDKSIWVSTTIPSSSCNPALVHEGGHNSRSEISAERALTCKNCNQDSNQNLLKSVAHDKGILLSTTKSPLDFGPRIINVNEAFDSSHETPALPGYTTPENGLIQSTKLDTNGLAVKEKGVGTSNCKSVASFNPYVAQTKHKKAFEAHDRNRDRLKKSKEIGTGRKLSRVPENEVVVKRALPGSSDGGANLLSQPVTMVSSKGTTAELSVSGTQVCPRKLPNKIRTSMRSSKRYDGSSVLQRKTTRMLFITSLVFLLSWLPYWIYVIGLLLKYSGVGVGESFQHVTDEFPIIIFINDVVNPLIYGISNARFRKDCRELFRKTKIC